MDLHPYAGGWVPVMELRYYAPMLPIYGNGSRIRGVSAKRASKPHQHIVIQVLLVIGFVLPSLIIVGRWRIDETVGLRQRITPMRAFTGQSRKITDPQEAFIDNDYPTRDGVSRLPRETIARSAATQHGCCGYPIAELPDDLTQLRYSLVNRVNVLLLTRMNQRTP